MDTVHVCRVKADAFKGLLKVAAKEDVRYYLRGVYVDTANGCLVATNGTTMLLAKQEFDAKPAPFIIPSELITAALKHTKKSAPDVQVSLEVEGTQVRKVRLDACKGFEIANEIEGRYPEYRRIIPAAPSGKYAYFDPDLLAALKQGISLVRGTEGPMPVEVLPNGTGPAVVAGKTSEALGIAMPWKMTGDTNWCAEALVAFGFKPVAKADKKVAA